MICKKCGVENADDVLFCTACGADLKEESVMENVVESPAKNPGKGLGITAFIMSLIALVIGGGLSVVCFPFAVYAFYFPFALVGIVAIILACIGNKKSKAAGVKNKLATIAIILSIFAIVIIVGASVVLWGLALFGGIMAGITG